MSHAIPARKLSTRVTTVTLTTTQNPVRDTMPPEPSR